MSLLIAEGAGAFTKHANLPDGKRDMKTTLSGRSSGKKSMGWRREQFRSFCCTKEVGAGARPQ